MSDYQPYFNQPNGDGSGNPLPDATQASEQMPPSQAASQEQAQGDEPVTLGKLREILSQHDREIQSRTDKVASALDKRYNQALQSVTQQVEEMKQLGIQLTAEQELALKNNRLNQVMTASGDTAQPEQPSGPVNPLYALVDQEVTGIVQANGLSEAETQQVYQSIPKGLTPLKFINEFEKRVAEYKASGVSRAASSLPGSAQGVAASGSDHLNQQLQLELDQINSGTHPSIKKGDVNAITGLVAAYRQKGARPMQPKNKFTRGI